MTWFKELVVGNLKIKQLKTLISLAKELEKLDFGSLKTDLEEITKGFDELLKATKEIEATWQRINTLKRMDTSPLH